MNSLISKRMGHSITAVLILALVLSLSGCALPDTLSAWKQTPKPENFQINYMMQNASRELDPWSSFSEQGLQAASWSSDNLTSATAKKPVELKIEFPHPAANSETALVTLSIFSQPLPPEEFQPQKSRYWMSRYWPQWPTSRKDFIRPIPDEVMTLEISHDEFEQLMSELNREQYLDENTKGHPAQVPASLSIFRNEHEIRSTREVAPQLNELIRKTYQDGTQILGTHHDAGPSVLQTSGLSAPKPLILE
jgi:hypothetical protein